METGEVRLENNHFLWVFGDTSETSKIKSVPF